MVNRLENKHDLPPNGISDSTDKDSSEILLFGDLFLLKKEKNKFKNFEVSDYGEFYNIIFGGFDDCITAEESEDEKEEDADYNPDEPSEEEDDESIDYNSDNNDDDEVELDNCNCKI